MLESVKLRVAHKTENTPYELYWIHPDANGQGLYLIIWFGDHEKVANIKAHGIKSAEELKSRIEAELPQELSGLIDVFVLDVSRPSK